MVFNPAAPYPQHCPSSAWEITSNSLIEAKFPILQEECPGRQKTVSRTGLALNVWWNTHEHQAAHQKLMVSMPRSHFSWSFFWWFSLCELPRLQVSWLCWSSYGVPVSWGPSVFLTMFLSKSSSPISQLGVSLCISFHWLLGGVSQRSVCYAGLVC